MIAGRRLVAALAAVAAASAGVGIGVAATAGDDREPERTTTALLRTAPPDPGAAPEPVASPVPGLSAATFTRQVRAGRWTVQLRRPAQLRTKPGGRQLARVTRTTGYGARRAFAVGGFRPGWIGVRAPQRPNDRLGWLPLDAVRLEPIRTTLVADLSERELVLRVAGRVRLRMPAGIGRRGSRTPVGRYGVTDRLVSGPAAAANYGCCVLPLTGRQESLPKGWTGGRRLAIHGSPDPGSVGGEVSAGCLRLRDADMRRLLARVPLGTTLTVKQ